jgi:hypothetical protein
MMRNRVYIALVLLALLVSIAAPTPAQETGHVCQQTTIGGLGLTGAGRTHDGLVKCLYGPVEALTCPVHSIDGRLLVRTVVKPSGRVKCVYLQEGVGGAGQ